MLIFNILIQHLLVFLTISECQGCSVALKHLPALTDGTAEGGVLPWFTQ